MVILPFYSNFTLGQDYHTILDSLNKNNKSGKGQLNLEVVNSLKIKSIIDQLPCYERGKLLHRVSVGLYLEDLNLEAAQYLRDTVIPIWESCDSKDLIDYANSIFNAGVFLQYAGRLQEAKSYLYQGMQLYESIENYPKIGIRYIGMAKYYNTIQDYERAEFYLQSALESFSDNEQNKSRRGRIIMDIGINQYYQKNYIQAIPNLKIAEQIFKELGDESRLAMSRHNIGLSFLAIKKLSLAEDYGNLALNYWDKDNHPGPYSNELELLAMVKKWKGEFASSKSMVRSTLKLRKKTLFDKSSISSSYENLAEISYLQGDTVSAINYIDTAIQTLIINPILDTSNNPIIKNILSYNDLSLIRTLAIKTEMLLNNRMTEKVGIQLYDKIDSLITKNLFQLKFENSKISYLQIIFDTYAEAINSALQLHNRYPQEAFLDKAYYFSTKTKAIALLSEIEENNIRSSFSDPGKNEREEKLFKHLNKLYPLLFDSTERRDQYLSEYLIIQRQMEELKDSIETELPVRLRNRFSNLSPLSVSEIQSLISSDELYIEFFINDNHGYSFWIQQDTFWCQTIEDLDLLKKKSDQFGLFLKDPSSSLEEIKQIGNDLYLRLLEDGIKKIPDKPKKLSVVADGFLQDINFDAFSNENNFSQYLIYDYIISRSYTSRLLFNNKNLIERNYLGFATDYSDKLNSRLRYQGIIQSDEYLSPLSYSEDEIESGYQLLGGSIYKDTDATKEVFLEEVGNYNILHLSLHGIVNKELPENSCLIFDDRSEDFILKMGELYSLDNNLDLVILSACHTATGKILPGEGVQGITKAFLRSGETQVVSSLWAAAEIPTLKIIEGFLSELTKGESLGSSLQKSKINYLHSAPPSQQHPYYWSNIILVGKSDILLRKPTHYFIYTIYAIFIIILGFLIRRFLNKQGPSS